MRLTQYSDYALRALMYLAVTPQPQELVNIQDIADSYNISKNHLTKIIHQLSKLGVIDSVRGKNGGIRLAKNPVDINIGAIIRQTEVDFAIVDCFISYPPSSSIPTDFHSEGKKRIAVVELAIPDSTFSENVIPAKGNTTSCVIAPVCELKKVFSDATQAFLAVLDGYTLADIVQNQAELKALLK